MGAPRQHHRHAIAQQPPLAGAAGHRVEVLANRCESLGQGSIRQEVDLLFRKIDGGFHIGAQLNHRARQHLDHGGELTLQRTHGGPGRLARAGVDEICDGLGLRQVQLVVQERALREFPRDWRAWLQVPPGARPGIQQ